MTWYKKSARARSLSTPRSRAAMQNCASCILFILYIYCKESNKMYSFFFFLFLCVFELRFVRESAGGQRLLCFARVRISGSNCAARVFFFLSTRVRKGFLIENVCCVQCTKRRVKFTYAVSLNSRLNFVWPKKKYSKPIKIDCVWRRTLPQILYYPIMTKIRTRCVYTIKWTIYLSLCKVTKKKKRMHITLIPFPCSCAH